MSSDHLYGPYRRKHRAGWESGTPEGPDAEKAAEPDSTVPAPPAAADEETAPAEPPTADDTSPTADNDGDVGNGETAEPAEPTPADPPPDTDPLPAVEPAKTEAAPTAEAAVPAPQDQSTAPEPVADSPDKPQEAAEVPPASTDSDEPEVAASAPVRNEDEPVVATPGVSATAGVAPVEAADEEQPDSEPDPPSDEPTMRLDSDPTIVLDAPRQAGSPGQRQSGKVGRARAGAVLAILSGVLGFGLVVQAQSTQSNSGLPSARQEDLVRILDDLDSRQDRLRREIAQLQTTRDGINNGAAGRDAALKEARRRERTLGVLAGTAPATGPGLVMTFTDPRHGLTADVILDAVQELRGAGAEAMQMADGNGTTVRIGVSSYFVDTGQGVSIDGKSLIAPYKLTVVGDPPTLDAAMRIPGGVVGRVSELNADVTIQQTKQVKVTALRPATTPQYAQPTS